ncbi:DUF3465 domain-containing protein [Zhongshania aquatica]|uniref:DUF3465 domain-containing protein n=1 Tax=Zhongshania aquatica TaxID=2965069 RepID=UPI0022B441A0|nr:DUF3465 domain-containing protein [Marortus sp. BJYM1]
MKKVIITALVLAALYSVYQKNPGIASEIIAIVPAEWAEKFKTTSATSNSDDILAKAFQQRRSDVQVRGSGIVIKVLPDDTKGSQHQRFIIKLASGQTVLIAHNIDLAPRLGGLAAGDRVEFYGEYEWNSQGGVVHWTHRDPAGRHIDGWLQYRGRQYQ